VRVVALTRDPSLGAALNMLDDWEVTAARDLDEVGAVARGASVVLIGLGDTDEGLDAAYQLLSKGVTIPAIVVGENAPTGSMDVPVLIRPFSLDDLRGILEQASEEGARNLTREVDVREQHRAEAPAREQETPAAPPSDPESGLQEADSAPEEKQREAVVFELHPERAVQEGLTKPVEAPPPPVPSLAEAGGQTATATEPSPAVPAPVARPTRQSALPPLPTKAVKERLGQGTGRGRLSRRRRHEPDQVAENVSPILRELQLAASASRTMEHLIDELPMLLDLPAMAEALMGEVVEKFRPETASLMLRRAEGFLPIASHGLSRTEQHMVVPESHPLLTAILEKSQPLLIAPVDLALGLVAGIGGARTEALMAAPLSVDGQCIAALIVGRLSFEDSELDALDDLAREAAPGLAVAQLLARLRTRS
jgi:GAF domain-containing protein